jgi:uncharacterized protein
LTAAAAVPLVACGRDKRRVPPGELVIATGGSGGVYYLYGQGIAEVVQARVPQLRPRVDVTSASADNMRRVAEGRAHIGFTQADTADKEAKGRTDVVALARVYDDYMHLVVPQESPVEKLLDLRGRNVAIGTAGSGTVDTVLRLFDVAGLDPDRDITAHRIGPQESATAMREGRIDAFFYSVGLPAGTVLTLGGWIPIRLVGIGEYAADLRKKYGPWYAEHTVPRSTYSMREPAVTIGVPNYLVVSANMAEATAYALTGALFDGRATLGRKHPAGELLNGRDAINTYPLRLHPGAARWYREHKL